MEKANRLDQRFAVLDSKGWENHPNGDELVFCSSGRMTFLLELEGKTEEVPLTAGNYLIVPKNTWHTAKVSEKAQALFITWGFGTRHRNA